MFPSEIGQGGLKNAAAAWRTGLRSARVPYLLWMGFPFRWPIPFAKNAVRMVRFMGLLTLMILRARL